MNGNGKRKKASGANVKLPKPQTRAFSLVELQKFFDVIDNTQHRLIAAVVYQAGCRVGELTGIQLKHIDFDEGAITFPAENTKTRTGRKSIVTQGLMSQLVAYLRERGLIAKRNGKVTSPEAYLFSLGSNGNRPYTTNRIRQIIRRYVEKAGLDETYGSRTDANGRQMRFHRLTVHSLRHSHITHAINSQGIPIPVVQAQVGHRNLKTTAAYSGADFDTQARAYRHARGGAE